MQLHRIALAEGADLDGFRQAVRGLITAGVPPEGVLFETGAQPVLFAADLPTDAPPVLLPPAATGLIGKVVCHRDPERYALLYALVWRLRHGEPHLLEIGSDPVVHRLSLLGKAIDKDVHRMHAFLRFRKVTTEKGERFVAFYEPDHVILARAVPFFVDRFRTLDWTILTPEGSCHWSGTSLAWRPPARRTDAPSDDTFEAGWGAYYESTFNPARTNPDLMRQHMPKRFWRHMPETAQMGELIRAAPSRVREMVERHASVPMKRSPDKALAAMHDSAPKTLAELNAIIAASRPLVPSESKAVLGEGPIGAAIAFVGEQPGDVEDQQGRPFVGPAGQLLDRAMAEAGIDRKASYLTNAVKHFKYEQRGKRRIHQKPTVGEIKHYRWWLETELELVRPKVVVALGASAVVALTGKSLPIIRSRGLADFGYITVHPSYILRLPNEAETQKAYRDFVADLTKVHAMVEAA
ncbi:MAG: UdgX family uracil-DNA binding protein [Hyphomicrobiaceae bacterium]